MERVVEIAKAFERRTNFKVRVVDGSFVELRNHKYRVPKKAGEPPMILHLMPEAPHGDIIGYKGIFFFHRRPGESGTNDMITAQHDERLAISAEKLTQKELAYALRHARILHRIIRAIKKSKS